jgi:hypothetical protein
MPVSPLPARPSLDHLKHQAKDVLRDHAAGSRVAAQRLREFHPRYLEQSDREIFAAKLSLADALLAIARQHGFRSWARIKRHILAPGLADRLDLPHHQRIESPKFRRAVELIDAGEERLLAELLEQHPELVHQRVELEGANWFGNPSLLEFVAENPVRHGKLPDNILAITSIILDAKPDQASRDATLVLVATGSVVHQQGVQLDMIELLCKHGASPDSALHQAALHEELDALRTLIRLGGTVDLPVAAALGLSEQFDALLGAADPQARHLAFALAAQFGHVAELSRLLEAGEDPNRYNPVGGHSHATALHQAVGHGHQEVVRLLIAHGARVDIKDVMWGATPAGWARHTGQSELEQLLRSVENAP